MGCSSTTNNCCPEAPDITVNVTEVLIDSDDAAFKQEIFGIGDSSGSAGLVFTLGFTPISNANVVITVNGVVQRLTTDYTLSSKTLTFVAAISSGDVVIAHYLAIL